MAFELVEEAIGLPLLERLRRHRSRLSPHVGRAADWLRNGTEPAAGLEVRSQDGSTYTEVIIVERSKPVVVLAVRHPGTPVPLRPPVVTPPPVERQHLRVLEAAEVLLPLDERKKNRPSCSRSIWTTCAKERSYRMRFPK